MQKKTREKSSIKKETGQVICYFPLIPSQVRKTEDIQGYNTTVQISMVSHCDRRR